MAAIRSPVSGQVLVFNAGAHTGLYYSTGLLPDDVVVEWTALPSFAEPIPSQVGAVVTVDPGEVSPEGAAVNAEIGTGLTDETFTAYISGVTGTIPSGMAGSEMTARFLVQYTPENPNSPDFPLPPVDYPSLTRIVRSGVVIAGTEPVGFPAALTSGQWTAEENRDTAPAGRREILVASSVTVPTGYQIVLFSGTGSADTQPTNGTVMTPGTAYTTTGVLAVGDTCNNRLWWRRLSDGALGNPSDTKSFTILGLEDDPGDPDYPDPPTSFPAADQTLTVATQAALVNALNTRIASGSTARWIIDIPPGNYGFLSLAGTQLPGKTIIRSRGLNYGAVFTGINMDRADNIYFQFVKVSRRGLPANESANCVTMRAVTDCGFEYGEIDGGPNVHDTRAGRPASAWLAHSGNGIYLDKTSSGAENHTYRVSIFMNYIHGCKRGIRWDGLHDSLIAENVFARIGGDNIQGGNPCTNTDFINNWGSRVNYITHNGTAVVHADYMQIDAQGAPGTNDIRYLGNVIMKSDWPWEGSPCQCIFSSKSITANHTYDNNICLTNAQQGIIVEHGTNGAVSSGHVVTNNTAIKLADGQQSQDHTRIGVGGTGITSSKNICSHTSGGGTGGINIPTSMTDRDGGEDYYHSCRVGASFYDFRPIAGTRAHWDYSPAADRVGAWQRYKDVIVDGKYPKIGAAALGWKLWYDPRNQITS